MTDMVFDAIANVFKGVLWILKGALRSVLSPLTRARTGIMQWVMLLVAVIVIAGSSVMLWRASREGRGSLNPLPYEQMGRVIAEQTATLTGNHGKIAIWQLRLTNKFGSTVDATAKSFRQALRHSPDITIAGTAEDVVQTASDLPVLPDVLPATRFLELLQQFSNVDVLVLLGTVPTLSDEDIARLPARRPKMTAASIFKMPPRRLLEKNVLQVVIAPRDHPAPGDTVNWFDRNYTVLTPDSAATLRR